MDVVLGVAVTGRVARLAMIDSPGTQVFDQYAFDLPAGDSAHALTELAETIIGTYREITDSGNRLAATRLCLPDAAEAETLRQTVAAAGVQNVEVVTEAEAAAALARSQGADASLLLADDDTVSLTVVGADPGLASTLASVPIGAAGAAVACASVLQQAPAHVRVMLTGQRLDLDSIAAELSSTTPVVVPPDAGYAIARGTAQTADGSGGAPAGAATQLAPAVDATLAAPAVDATQVAAVNAANTELAPQLAYSQSADEAWPEYADLGEMPEEALAEFVPEQEDETSYPGSDFTGSDFTGSDFTEAIPAPPPRLILMGSAVGFLVVSLATLAVTVAVNIRPAAVVSAQPPPTQADTVPGRYLPPVPHEPDPVALPVTVLTPPPAAPAAPVHRNVSPPAQAPVQQVPAPPVQAPPAPPQVGVPVVPIPIPPIVVFPPLNPWNPPTVTTTVTTTPTTTTTAPTTTTTTPTTTTPTTTTSTTSPTTSTSSSSSTSTSTAPPPTSSTEPPIEPVTPVTPVQPVTPVTPAEPAYTAPSAAPEPAPVTTVEAPPKTPSSDSGGRSSGSGHSEQAPVTTVSETP